MNFVIEYADGRRVSPDAFRSENRNLVYAGDLPPQAALQAVGASLVQAPPTAADVAAEWQRRVDAGSAFTVTGVTDPIPVPGRQPYREIIQAKLSAAQLFAAQGITDPVVMFRDGANTSHMLTPAQMIELCIASMRFYEALSAVYWAMKDGTGDFTGGIPADFTDDGYWP